MEKAIMERTEILQGTLDMLILKTLEGGPRHGFGIAERIRALSEEVLRVGEGSLYPALYRLERRGWIQSEWGQSDHNRRAKYYTLTKPGRRQLEAESESWKRLCLAIRQVMQST